MQPDRFSGGQRRTALRVAILGNWLPIAVATATDFSSHHTIFFIGAAIGAVVPVVVLLTGPDRPLIFYTAAYGGLVGLTMMLAYSGGVASGYSVLLMMAMIWFGLQGSDRVLIVGITVLAACAYLPMVIFGPPAYPVDWGHATLLVLVGASVAGSLRTMTRETQRLTKRLREEALMDDLTGLLNRRGWESAARRDLSRAQRKGTPAVLVMLDLDGLKELNDTMGHEEGDRALRETAERMRGSLREADVLARLGGDEFAALFSDAELDDVVGVVARLEDATPQRASFSTGVAVWDRSEDLDDLVRRGDLALYEAKAAGGGQLAMASKPIGEAEPTRA